MKIKTLILLSIISISWVLMSIVNAENRAGDYSADIEKAVEILTRYRESYFSKNTSTKALLDYFVDGLSEQVDALTKPEWQEINTLNYRLDTNSYSADTITLMFALNAPIVIIPPALILEVSCASLIKSELCIGMWGPDRSGRSKFVRFGFRWINPHDPKLRINAVLVADDEENDFSSLEWGEHLFSR